MTKIGQYRRARDHIRSLIEGEADEVVVMATLVCELHHGLKHLSRRSPVIEEASTLDMRRRQARRPPYLYDFHRSRNGVTSSLAG